MTASRWLGIDLGTQSVRAVLMDSDGRMVGSGAAPLTSQRSGERHEQDPEQWWDAVCSAVRAAVRDVSPATIRGVAVDGTSGTILLTDRQGQPLTPGLMYDDGRAGAESVRVNESGAELWSRLGYRSMPPSWALPKLVWLIEHEPKAFDRGTRLLHQSDFVTWRLAGHQQPTDISNALKTGADLVGLRWPREILQTLGVPNDILPELVLPGSPLGTVGEAAAARTGLRAGTPIVAGMTDGCASQLGAGALEVGSWNSVLGTTLVLKGVSPALVDDPLGVVYCHRGPDGTWLPGGASSSGAGVISRDFPQADLAALTDAARRRPIRAVTYPLVSQAGERFPFRAADAESFTTTRDRGVLDDVDRFNAALVGVACVERLCLDYLDLIGAPTDGQIRLTGGGSRNEYWCQLRSDVLGRELQRVVGAEAAHGMAMLASTGDGRSITEAAAAMVSVQDTFAPDLRRTVELTDHYLTLVDELVDRGWLDTTVRVHAHRRAAR